MKMIRSTVARVTLGVCHVYRVVSALPPPRRPSIALGASVKLRTDVHLAPRKGHLLLLRTVKLFGPPQCYITHHHGGQILILAHDLLAQVDLHSSRNASCFTANMTTAVSWYRLVCSLLYATCKGCQRPNNTDIPIEYALNAVNQGVTSLGIKGTSK
jgi:hypothetical protein